MRWPPYDQNYLINQIQILNLKLKHKKTEDQYKRRIELTWLELNWEEAVRMRRRRRLQLRVIGKRSILERVERPKTKSVIEIWSNSPKMTVTDWKFETLRYWVLISTGGDEQVQVLCCFIIIIVMCIKFCVSPHVDVGWISVFCSRKNTIHNVVCVCVCFSLLPVLLSSVTFLSV